MQPRSILVITITVNVDTSAQVGLAMKFLIWTESVNIETQCAAMVVAVADSE